MTGSMMRYFILAFPQLRVFKYTVLLQAFLQNIETSYTKHWGSELPTYILVSYYNPPSSQHYDRSALSKNLQFS